MKPCGDAARQIVNDSDSEDKKKRAEALSFHRAIRMWSLVKVV